MRHEVGQRHVALAQLLGDDRARGWGTPRPRPGSGSRCAGGRWPACGPTPACSCRAGSAACFISLANFGKCSLMRMPGTDVSIGLNSPRTSAGASGLGSNVSMWLGPPAIQSRMHDLGRGPSGAAAASRPSQPHSDAPAAAAATNSRRPKFGRIASSPGAVAVLSGSGKTRWSSAGPRPVPGRPPRAESAPGHVVPDQPLLVGRGPPRQDRQEQVRRRRRPATGPASPAAPPGRRGSARRTAPSSSAAAGAGCPAGTRSGRGRRRRRRTA